MATQTEARHRSRERRQEGLRLGQDFARLEAGEGGLADLGRLVCNERLVLSDRLRAMEVGLKRRLIREEQLLRPQAAPTPMDFGLPVATSRDEGVDIVEAVFAFLEWIAGCCVFVMLANLLNGSLSANTHWLLFGGSILGAAIVAKGRVWTQSLVDRAFPLRVARRRFREAALLHDVVSTSRQIRALEGDVRAFHSASGPEFERLVARSFRRHGYRVEELGGANDGGIDLLVWKGSFHAIVQCKAHGKPAGPAIVRELLGTLAHSKQAKIAYLATVHGVTESAREWCRDKPIVILEADHIIRGRF